MAEIQESIEKRRAAARSLTTPLVQALQELARCDDSKLRCQALCALGSLRHPASLKLLRESLEDPETRTWARNALVHFSSPGSLEALGEFLLRDPTSPFALESIPLLGDCETPEAAPLLLQLGEHASPEVRQTAATGLTRLGPRHDVEDRILELLRAPERDVAVAALLALREVGSDRATLPLMELLQNSRNLFVRSTSLLTLGKLAPTEANEAVKQYLEDPEPRIRASAVEALGLSIEDHLEDVPLLLEALRDDHNRVRGNAIVGLWKIDPDPCRKPFLDLLKNPRPVWRATAAWVVGQVQAPELFSPFLTVVNTELDQDVLAMGLQSIAALENPALAPQLAALLEHPNRAIRLAAARSFRCLAPKKERNRLIRALLQEQDPEILLVLIRGLGRLSDVSNFSELIPFLEQEDSKIVAATLEALEAVGDLAVRPIIEANLSHRAPAVRLQALRSLIRLGEVEQLPTLVETLRSGNPAWLRLACQTAHEIGLSLQEAIRSQGRLPFLEAALDVTVLPQDEEPGEFLSAREVGQEDRSLSWELECVEKLLAGQSHQDAENHLTTGFLPGLMLDLERSRKLGAPPQDVQKHYLAVAEVHLQLYQEFLGRVREHTSRGETAASLQMLGVFFQQLKLTPDLQERLARTYLQLGEYDLAFRHLLPLASMGPPIPARLLEVAEVALRLSKTKLAGEILRGLIPQLTDDSPERQSAQRMLDALDPKPASPASTC